ncbi:MAG: aminoglycoside phosphotransferase family protein [Actinomycetota bacterium]|nr:aminoglycoside phosphotransferase family protein [Actinomycetota bacterium]
MPDAEEQAVAEAVRGSLGVDAREIEPAPGGHHGVWFVVAGDESVVVKSSPLVQFEAWAATAVREFKVPAAEVLAVEPAASSPLRHGHLISRRLPGSPLRAPGATVDRPAVARHAGVVLRRIHEVTGTGFGAPRGELLRTSGEVRGAQATWPRAIETWVDRHLGHLVPDAIDAPTAARIRSAVAAHEPGLARHERSTLLHGDYTHRHVLVLPDEPRIIGVLDFDGGLFGAPAFDLAVWSIASPDVNDLALGYEPDPEARRALLDQLPLYRLVRYAAEVRWALVAGVDPHPATERMLRGLAVVEAALDA